MHSSLQGQNEDKAHSLAGTTSKGTRVTVVGGLIWPKTPQFSRLWLKRGWRKPEKIRLHVAEICFVPRPAPLPTMPITLHIHHPDPHPTPEVRDGGIRAGRKRHHCSRVSDCCPPTHLASVKPARRGEDPDTSQLNQGQ